MKTIITISRQYGSGGFEAGKRLAENLNIPIYNKELLALAAKKSGISGQIDHKMNDSLLYSLAASKQIDTESSVSAHQTSAGSAPTDEVLLGGIPFSVQANFIRQTILEGPCVLVGCCADYILRDEKNVFNVFIHADEFYRMDRIVQTYSMNPEQAANYLLKKDKDRAVYYNFYTGRKWGDLENYHLTLDSASTDIDGIVELIKAGIAIKEAAEKKGLAYVPFATSAAMG